MMPVIVPLLVSNNSSNPCASTVLILKLTVTASPLPPMFSIAVATSRGITVELCLGTISSGPSSPTTAGCPPITLPPLCAVCALIVATCAKPLAIVAPAAIKLKGGG